MTLLISLLFIFSLDPGQSQPAQSPQRPAAAAPPLQAPEPTPPALPVAVAPVAGGPPPATYILGPRTSCGSR